MARYRVHLIASFDVEVEVDGDIRAHAEELATMPLLAISGLAVNPKLAWNHIERLGDHDD
jgi:hypothetical protein